MARNYQKENVYKKKPAQIKAREERNLASAIMERAGKVKKGDGKQVDHIKPISKGGKTVMSNLRVLTAHMNDSFPRSGHKLKTQNPKLRRK